MPHKFNAARRHKFDKAQYRVIHWAEYNESLRQRGDLTIWVSDEAQSVWRAPRRTSRGGQRRYSDLAIETCLTLRTTYRLGLRQTQRLMGSIGTLMGRDIRVPDYSTLSRRANGLSIAQAVRQAVCTARHYRHRTGAEYSQTPVRNSDPMAVESRGDLASRHGRIVRIAAVHS